MVCTDYYSKQTKLRGFDFHDETLGALKNFTGIIESGEDWYYFINKDYDSKNCYESIKSYPYEFPDNKTVFRRKNGIITLYLNDKLFYTYKDKFEYPVEILGCMRINPSRIDNFSLKQL